MSQQLIARSGDLLRLRNEGYDIEVKDGHLLVRCVPYVNCQKKICFGTFVCVLNLAGDVTVKPATHVGYFVGEYPCDKYGTYLDKLVIQSEGALVLKEGIVVQHTLSSKPFPLERGYIDYYEEVTTYLSIISNPAKSLDSSVTAQTFPIVVSTETESVFCYTDTASTRAGISTISDKLASGKVAIVGLGGTGSYILDLIAKTAVKEIHLFDGDVFSQHNAFRSPGAPNVEKLRERPQKVDYFADIYLNMHRFVIPHNQYVTEVNVEQLKDMDFVFISIDNNTAKKMIVSALESFSVSFIDVGMGIYTVSNSLGGIIRVTASSEGKTEYIHEKKRIPFGDGEVPNEYKNNIQIADLNSLNATLAVIRWKKLAGFYLDLEKEHHSTYTIDGNILQNEDQAS